MRVAIGGANALHSGASDAFFCEAGRVMCQQAQADQLWMDRHRAHGRGVLEALSFALIVEIKEPDAFGALAEVAKAKLGDLRASGALTLPPASIQR